MDNTDIIRKLTKKRICAQSYKEAMLLSKVATRVSSGIIIEIGRAIGGSLVILGKSSPDSYIYSIDINDARNTDVLDLCNKYEVTNYEMLVGDSQKIGKSWKEEKGIRIDMLFIDGDHSYKSIYDDLCSWVPHVEKGGIVMMHDCPRVSWIKSKRMIKRYEPARKALRTFNRKKKYGCLKTIKTADTMRYLIKK
jgi:predicted O-methyltransferase YrrM